MTPLEVLAVAAATGAPLGVLWGAASWLLARRSTRRLAAYDAAVIAKAGQP